VAAPARKGLPWVMLLVGAAAIVGVLIVGVVLLQGLGGKPYTCGSLLAPPPVQEDSNGLGFPNEDLGHLHVASGSTISYAFCPPTSGNHYASAGSGPVAARVYGPGNELPPGGWVHNLEHGYVAVLYRCPSRTPGSGDCATPEAIAQMQQWFDAQPTPPGCATKQVLVARFDEMETAFAVVAWRRALLLDSFDLAKATTFAQQWTDAPTAPEASTC
jgi:hypothetical protein